MRETELLGPVTTHLQAEGYRVYPNADAEDFFDVVARRAEELGIVELKVADWSHALYQAVERRQWADWVAVVLPRRSLAERLRRASSRPLTQRIGIWVVEDGEVRVVRAAHAVDRHALPEVWEESRQRLVRLLDLMDRGEIPAGTSWASAALARGPRGRGRFRLEEFTGPAPSPREGD